MVVIFTFGLVFGEREKWNEIEMDGYSFFVDNDTKMVKTNKLKKLFRKINSIINTYSNINFQKGKRTLDKKDSIRVSFKLYRSIKG